MREALKTRTQEWHARTERDLALADPALTLAEYQRLLGRFWGFHAPLEARLAAHQGALGGLDLTERRRTPALEADLRHFGLDPATLPRCGALPEVGSRAQALGCLYVLEGSTLGGQMLARHFAGHFGLTVEAGCAFFAGYGALTGDRWRAFLAVLSAAELTDDEREAALGAATDTFRCLHAWATRRT